MAWGPALSSRLTTTPQGEVPKDGPIQQVFIKHLLCIGSVLALGSEYAVVSVPHGALGLIWGTRCGLPMEMASGLKLRGEEEVARQR